jgi:hypothetical protein
MKREGSRFSLEELNLVISNWEKIADEFGGKFKLLATKNDNRNLFYQAINPNNIDHIETVSYSIEVKIPFLGKNILIKTSEYVTTKFSFETLKNDFSFSISNEDYLDKIGKFFGSKETQIEQPDFDKKFLIDTNESNKLKDFLDFKIRTWLENLSIAYFDLNTIKSRGGLTLFFVFDEFSIEKIREQIEMFKYCITRLKK